MRLKNLLVMGSCWFILFLAIACVYVSVATERISRYHFYNSDAISVPAMYNDLVAGYSLRGWLFGPAPSLFPDLPLYALLRWMSGNVHVAIALYGVVQMLWIAAGFLLLSRLIFGADTPLQPLLLLAGSLVCFLLATGQWNVFLPMLLSSFHFGAVVSLLFGLILVVRLLKADLARKRCLLYVLALSCLTTLTLLSDEIYVVQFIIPVLLSVFGLFVCARLSAQRLWWIFSSIGIACPVTAWMVRKVFIFLPPPGQAASISMQEIMRRAVHSYQEIARWPEKLWIAPRYFTVFNIVWIGFVFVSLTLLVMLVLKQQKLALGTMPGLFLVGIVGLSAARMLEAGALTQGIVFLSVSGALAFLIFRSPSRRDAPVEQSGMMLFILSFFVLTILINIAAALFIGGGEPRYFLPAMLIALFFGWPFLIGLSQRLLRVLAAPVTMPALIGGLMVVAWQVGGLGNLKSISSLAALADYYPEFARCVDENAQRRNIRNGLTQYWDAKYLSMLSKTGLHLVQVRQLQQGLWMEHFVNNLNWYNTDFDFVILEEVAGNPRSIWESNVIADYGAPADEFMCRDERGNNRLVLVYNRPENAQFRTLFRRYFEFEFSAAELPSETGQVVGSRRQAETSLNQKGFLTYGPYVALEWGDYTFTIEYEAQPTAGKKAAGAWDIVFHDQHDVIATMKKGKFTRQGQQTVSGVFNIRADGNTEIRTYYSGAGRLAVEKITIRRIR